MTSKIALAFNRAANSYDDASHMQRFALKKLITHLDDNLTHQMIADLGCGSGYSTKKIASLLSFDQCYAIDFAKDSIKRAELVITHEAMCAMTNPSQNIHFMQMDFDHLSFNQPMFTLLFSNMALHWSKNVEKLIEKLYELLLTHGLLAFTVPLTGTLCELQQERVRPFFTLEEIATLLLKNNFLIQTQKQYHYTIEYPSQLHALRALKKTGVTHLENAHHGLRGREYLTKLFQSSVSTLSYEIGLFIARKP